MTTDTSHFERAIARFDFANGEDPNRESVAARGRPKELVYAARLACRQRRARHGEAGTRWLDMRGLRPLDWTHNRTPEARHFA